MTDYLRYAHLSEPELKTAFLDIIRHTGFLMAALVRARGLELAQWRILAIPARL